MARCSQLPDAVFLHHGRPRYARHRGDQGGPVEPQGHWSQQHLAPRREASAPARWQARATEASDLVEEGARIMVDLATLPDDGPTGGLLNDRGPVPW